MTPASLLLLGVYAAVVPIDVDNAVAGDRMDAGAFDLVLAPASASLVEEGRHRSLSGVGPEIPLPLYYSSPDSVLAVGPEGQLEHVKPEMLSAGQLEMMKSMTGKFFDGSGHIPVKTTLGMCRSWYGTEEGLEECISTVSKMTPVRMSGMRKIIMEGNAHHKPVKDQPDRLRELAFLDRGKAFLEGDATDPATQCGFMAPDLRDSCLEVLTSGHRAGGPATSCQRMEIDNESFTTSQYAYSLDHLTPFFTRQKYFHYFAEEKELRTKYETVPTRYGCGVRAKTSFERGDLIGLAGIAHATFYQGLMVALQETPWLGTNMNHCPEKARISMQDQVSQDHANAVVKLVEEDHKPTALWMYASEPIPAGAEITMDYNAASEKFPNFISPAPWKENWKCMKSRREQARDKARELRTEGAH